MAAGRQCALLRNLFQSNKNWCHIFSTSGRNQSYHYKLVVLGGGTGGSAVANKYAKKLGVGNVAVIEPSENHFYQPMFTLVGSGVKKFEQTRKPTNSILPQACSWIKESVTGVDPDKSKVFTSDGKEITYDYLVVAMGLKLRYDLIKGAEEALKSDPAVCSNYSPQFVHKTFPAMQNVKSGNAIFTFPNTPIKCAGAPQKIMYLSEEYFRKNNVRDNVNVIYNTSLPVIFGIPKYAAALTEIVRQREIIVNFRHNLVEVRHESKEAVFENLDNPDGDRIVFEYAMLHIGAPCSPIPVLKESALVDATGFVSVNRDTLQHTKYPNVFGIGDCTNAPTAKTAAAVSTQSGIVSSSINAVMAGKTPTAQYDGYTSCPLITSKGKCILAEFGYDGRILETFPIDQSKERRSMYLLKADIMPHLYWAALVKGKWNGPSLMRRTLNLGMNK